MSEPVLIHIANRTYPLKLNKEEATNLKTAEEKINRIISDLEKNYAVSDKQDLLAMCLIQIAGETEKLKLQLQSIEEKSDSETEWLISKIEDHLNSNNVL